MNEILSIVDWYLTAEAEAKRDPDRLAEARRERDDALSKISGIAGKRLARVRYIFQSHDSRVDYFLAMSDAQLGEQEKQPQSLNQALRLRVLAYLKLIVQLSIALNIRDYEQSDLYTGDWRAVYVDTVANFVEEVAELEEVAKPEEGDTRTSEMMQKVLALRIKRDLALHLLEVPHLQSNQARIRRHLADYDHTVDAVISTSSIVMGTTVSETFSQAAALFAARLKNEAEERKLWLRVWLVGSVLGLLAIVAAFMTSTFNPFGWSWIMVCIAGLGALIAALYTLGAARGSSTRANWILVALPFLVLVVALILPFQDGQTPAITTVAVILIIAVVLGSISLWVIRHDPREPHLRSTLSFHSLGLLEGSSSSRGGTTDWDRYLVADELATLRARISHEAAAQHRASIAWATTFILVGGLAALLSGAAGVTAAQEQWNDWVIGLAIGGAGLTALMTALNPGRRWEQARALQLACQSLEQEVGVLIRLDLNGNDANDPKGRQKIEHIAKMYDTLLGLPERPRLWRADPTVGTQNLEDKK